MHDEFLFLTITHLSRKNMFIFLRYSCRNLETESHIIASIDNRRNGLETLVKSLMLLMLHPWYGQIRFTLEPCISNLNIFQDFVFTNFKKEQQCLSNYWLLKLLLGITKLSPSLNVCVIFDFRNIAIAYRLKKFYQNIQWWFSVFFTSRKSLKSRQFCRYGRLFLNM